MKALDYLYELFPNYKQYIKQELSGPGIQGIFDKLILVNSDYFISGPKGCARVISKFTRKIREDRIRLINSGDKHLLNDISRWYLD